MALLETTKQYLRIDGTGEDAQITMLISAAEAYLTNAGIVKVETNTLYCLAVQMLVSHWYDNRGDIIAGTVSKMMEYGLNPIIAQLKFTPIVEVV